MKKLEFKRIKGHASNMNLWLDVQRQEDQAALDKWLPEHDEFITSLAADYTEMRVRKEVAREILRETGEELKKWMEEETSPFRKIAQAKHAIIKLRRGQALKQQEVE